MTFQPRLLSDGRVACCSTHFPYSAKMRGCLAELRARGLDEPSAIAIATTSLEIAGDAIFEESVHKERTMSYAPPDSYAPALLRAATATPASDFEDVWKADRLRAMYATRSALDAEAPRPRLTAAEEAELATYAAPDGWALALKALKETR